MVLDCVHWRRTVEDVGIEELYRRIDPYDVRSSHDWRSPIRFQIFRNLPDLRQFPGREEVFESWPMGFHKVRKTLLFHFPPGAHTCSKRWCMYRPIR